MSIIYRPWRVEYTSKKVQFEISIWDVCRVVKATGEKCYPGEYSNVPGKEFNTYPMDTECKLNVRKTFKKLRGRLLNVLCTFNLRLASRG